MTCDPMTSALAGVDFDPLLATWPKKNYDEELLSQRSPAVTRYILKKAYKEYKAGYTEDEKLWAEWLAFFKELGPGDFGIREALLGLSFIRHEARHHLDFYSTPLGWLYPSALAGYYLRLFQLTQVHPDSAQGADLISRLTRSKDVTKSIFGNIPTINAEKWEENPRLERKIKVGTLRFRLDRTDPRLGLATIQMEGGSERALSLNGILEARAVIETTGYMSGRLRAAGADREKIISAIRLLLDATVEIARDDYWGLLSIGLSTLDKGGAAVILTDRSAHCHRLMIATWFALHIEPAGSTDVDVSNHPTFRLVHALDTLYSFSDQELMNPKVDWNATLDRFAQIIGGRSLADLSRAHQTNLSQLRWRLDSGGLIPDGLAHQHVSYLVGVAEQGMALRGQPLAWLDQVGWPEMEDPNVIVNWSEPTQQVWTARSRLTRIENMIKTKQPISAIIDLAKSMF